MHGRPRIPKAAELNPEALAARDRKAALLKSAADEVLRRRREKLYDAESLALAANFLSLNPEVYTVWNYRREAILPALEAGDGCREEILLGELKLIGQALKRNPKSYAAWHHRQWIVSGWPCDLAEEFRFVEARLDEDARNFHAWNYRRFLATLPGSPPASAELDYSQAKIEQNFSNFSAWHHRTKVLPRVHGEVRTIGLEDLLKEKHEGPPRRPGAVPARALDEEYDVCHSAFSTDAEDSSAWFYYRWLLGNSIAAVEEARGTDREAVAVAGLRQVIEREIDRMEEDHLVGGGESKWPLLALARLKETKMRLLGEGDGLGDEVREIYGKLMDVDPQRKGYYQDARDGKVAVMTLGTQVPS